MLPWGSCGPGLARPEDPDADDDAELDGRDLICDRLVDEVGWIRQCADKAVADLPRVSRDLAADRRQTPPNWPAPAAPPTSVRRAPCLTRGPNAG